jgi:hypothetical protein
MKDDDTQVHEEQSIAHCPPMQNSCWLSAAGQYDSAMPTR